MEVTTVKGTPPIIHIYEHQIVGCFDHNQIDQSGTHLVDDSSVPHKKVKYEMNQIDLRDADVSTLDERLSVQYGIKKVV